MQAEYDISTIKQAYRKIFQEACTEFLDRLAGLRGNHACPQCDAAGDSLDLLNTYHPGCGYRAWQQKAMAVIENDIARDILVKLKQIEAYKATFNCHQCGVCCRFASSEFSYEQLQEKARTGDSFATQFTSIFLPYASTDAAHDRFPEIVDSVLDQAGDEEVYFYHCPYIGEDNRCTIYGQPKRPAICQSYPDTPLTFIYKNCAWRPWKEETHPDALWAHAMIELCSDTLGKLKSALS